jgi:hypothetical protein
VQADVLCHVFHIARNEKKNSDFDNSPWSQFSTEITDSRLFLLNSPFLRGGDSKRVVTNHLQQNKIVAIKTSHAF